MHPSVRLAAACLVLASACAGGGGAAGRVEEDAGDPGPVGGGAGQGGRGGNAGAAVDAGGGRGGAAGAVAPDADAPEVDASAPDARAVDAAPPADVSPAATDTRGNDAADAAPAAGVCPAGPFPAPAPGASQAVCAGFAFRYGFFEGPTWIASQNAFFFSNFVQGAATRGDIVKFTPGGGCEIFIRDVGCNGLGVSPDGALLAACHQSRSVIRFDPVTKAATTLASRYMGQMLDTPNDLVARRDGTIYFTNPTYELAGRPEGVGMAVFRIDPAGVLHAVSRGGRPNGIALSPDEKRLYVIGGGIWELDAAGAASGRREMFTSGDGMAVDCAGNVYSSSGGIFTAGGQRIGSFTGGTNVAFGGADGRTLLVTGGGARVRTIQMNLPGLP